MATLSSAPSSVQAAGSWANGSNAYSSNNSYATLATSTSSDLDLRGFNFASIPANSVISAIRVYIEHFEDATNQRTLTATIMSNTTVIDGQNVPLHTGESTDTVTFAAVPTLTQLQASDFQFRITGARTAGGTKNFSVDSILVEVDYTPPVTGTSAQTLDAATSSAIGYAGTAVTGTSAQTLANSTSAASGYAGTAVTGTSAPTLGSAASAATGFVGPSVSGTSAVVLDPATSSAQGNATVPIITLDYIEMRLYSDLTATSFVLLPNYVDVQFDVKYNDIGAITFNYPLEAAEALGLTDQDLIGVVLGFSNGTTVEIDRYFIESTNDEKVKDDQRIRSFTGRSSLAILNDAKVYPSNWKVTAINSYSRSGNVATLDVGASHGYGVAQKVFVVGIDSSFNGEVILSSVGSTTISYPSTGTNLGTTTGPANSFVVSATPSGHSFTDSTVGTILRTLVDRAQARGALTQVDESTFSGTNDSNGIVWGELHTQNYSTGTDYYELLQEFMERGYVDAWMDGWKLRVVNGGDRGQHVGIGTVELRPAKNVTEMVTTTNSAESASTVLIEGDEGTAVERHNPSAQTLLGRRRERYVQQGGIRDAGVLTLLGNAELDLYGRVPTEETVGVAPNGLMPFVDFQISDWVWVRYKTDQAPVERRIRQIGVSVDKDRQITFGITLNSILYEADVALKRRMDALTGNGGTYGSVPNSIPDTTTPRAPTGLGITSGTYIDSGNQYRGAFVANWTAPTQNVDGSTVSDLSFYEVQYRYYDTNNPTSEAAPNEWKPILRTAAQETTLGYSPVAPGATAQVRVRAVDTDNHRSEWITVNTTFDKDTTGPAQPSTPVATDKVGRVDVFWDGKDSSAQPMATDFNYVEVWQSPTPGFTPGVGDAVLVGQLFTAGTQSCPGGNVNEVYYFKLLAKDKAGNSSTPSLADDGKVLAEVVPTPGDAPASSPTPSVVGGVGSLFVKWEALTSAFPLIYDIHVSTKSGFTPDLTTLAATVKDATTVNIKYLRKNLLNNGNFEDANSPFTVSTGTWERYDTSQDSPVVDPVSGIWVGKWTPAATGAQYAEYNDNIPAVAGDKIRLAARAQAPSGAQNFTASMRWFNASNSLLSTSTTGTASAATGSYGLASDTVEAPAGASYGRWRLNLLSAANGQAVYVDLLEAVADDTTEPLVYDTTYYVKIVARVGTQAGPASAEASDELYRVTNQEVSADYVYAGEIFAEQITGGSITATVGISTGKIQVGSNLSIDAISGFKIDNPATGVTIALPPDGSSAKFLGVEIDATSVNVQNKLKILGQENFISGKLLMQSSISPPNTQPSLTNTEVPLAADMVDGITLPGTVTGYIPESAWFDGTDYVVCSGSNVYKINPTTGASTLFKSDIASVIFAYNSTITSIQGGYRITKLGTDWYIACNTGAYNASLGVYQYQTSVFRFNAAMSAITNAWYSNTTQALGLINNYPRGCGVTTDGTNIFVAVPVSTTQIKMVQLSSTLGSYTLSGTITDGNGNFVSNIWRGNFDFGALRWVINYNTDDRMAVFTVAATPVSQPNSTWSGSYDLTASVWDTVRSKWVSITRDPSLSDGSLGRIIRWPAVAADRTVTVTWTFYDPAGTTHETTTSTAGALYAVQQRRRWFVVSTPAPPGGAGVDDPTTVKIYGRTDGGTPLRLQNGTNGWPVAQLSQQFADFDNASGVAPPSINGFESVVTPGIFESQGQDANLEPFIYMKGTGQFKLGNMTFDPVIADDMEINGGPSGTGVLYVENLSVYGDTTIVDATVSGKLLLTDTTDATNTTGNEPALRIGSTSGTHLRIDNNEIIAMTADATQGTLALNPAGAVSFGGSTINAINWDIYSGTTNGSGQLTITHGLGGTPTLALATGAGNGSTNGKVYVTGAGATTFLVGYRNSTDGSVYSGISVNGYWLAIR